MIAIAHDFGGQRSGDRRPTPTPCCWVAEAWIDACGRDVNSDTANAIGLFAVSVHEEYPSNVEARLALMRFVAHAVREKIPAGRHTLWVYPGGYFGFSAQVFQRNPDLAWHGFDQEL